MPCYDPLKGYVAREVNPTGKRSIVFDQREGYLDMRVDLPCGQCIGCRLERSRQWAIRCVHEASLYQDNCFITLTYDDEHIPQKLNQIQVFEDTYQNYFYTLVKADFQKFMKRLRKKYPNQTIRYYQCGEYGELNKRPHYHACLFNFNFPDRKLQTIRNDVKLYTSAILQSLWTKGFSTIGDVTFESAAYVARYVMKKVTGEKAEEHYQGRIPEYTTMSRVPGIGTHWYNKFKNDIYNHDKLILRGGVEARPPKFYDKMFEVDNPQALGRFKLRRLKVMKRLAHDNTNRRLIDKCTVKLRQTETLKRGL